MLNGNLKFEVIPGSLLEKGLNYIQNRQSELENHRFQIQVLSQNLSAEDQQSKQKIDELLISYNNLQYPHLSMERATFAESGKATFEKLKNKHKDLKFKEKAIDKNKEFKITI